MDTVGQSEAKLTWISTGCASLSRFLLDYPLLGPVVSFQALVRKVNFLLICPGMCAHESVVKPTGGGRAFIIY